MPSDSGQLDNALPCSVGSEIKSGADGRCRSVLQAQGWLCSSVTSPPEFFSWQAAPQTSTTSTPLLHEIAKGFRRVPVLSGCETAAQGAEPKLSTANVHVKTYLAVPMVQTDCLSSRLFKYKDSSERHRLGF